MLRTPYSQEASEASDMSDKRPPINLACETCKRRNYVTQKNKANTRERIELKKYCRFCRAHTPHKETR